MNVTKADHIAIIGDVHGFWNEADSLEFSKLGVDLLLFVGDLGSGTRKNGVEMISRLSKLRVPGLVLPGNNDAPHLAHLGAEWGYQSGKADLLRLVGSPQRVGIRPCGFTAHELSTKSGNLTLIAARPCAMGGGECSFPEELSRNYGVSSIEESIKRLKTLVDQSSTEAIVFVAHNGPYGLGGKPRDLWSRDFPIGSDHDAPNDWGDHDLSEAIKYAKNQGKRVDGVIAGHMHRGSEGKTRPATLRFEGTTYVNSAVVPRIRTHPDGELHHFVELRLDPGAKKADERFMIDEKWFNTSWNEN